MALNLSDFRDCIGPNTGSHGTYCQLDANPGTPYVISSTLNVTRSSIIIDGTIVTSVADTTLQRGSGLGSAALMALGSSGSPVSHVLIEDLTFDGNRGGISGLTCVSGSSVAPVELSSQYGSYTHLYDLNVINSPGISVLAGYALYATTNTFSYGRVTAIHANYSGSFDNLYLYTNTFEHYGVGAVELGSNTSTIWGNYFFSNHEEFIYGEPGGQIFGTGLSNVTLSSNQLDGNSVTGTVGSAGGYFSCIIPSDPPNTTTGTVLGTAGVEVHNVSGLALYNNSIAYHVGDGIFANSTSSTALFSTFDPLCVGCYVNNIGGNSFNGINLVGNTTAAVTFDGIEATYNGGWGISIDNPSSGTTSVQFQNNVCLSGNTSGRFTHGASVSVTGFPGSDTCPTH